MDDRAPSDAQHSIPSARERELELLTSEKLALEIRNLRRPWRHPSALVPIAAIVSAFLGLIWAIASGFFDVSRRELDVRKRELEDAIRALEQRRDSQSQQYSRDLSSLHKQIQVLTERVTQIDQPTLTLVQSNLTSPQSGTVTLGGVNLGTGGTVYIRVVGREGCLRCEEERIAPNGSVATPYNCQEGSGALVFAVTASTWRPDHIVVLVPASAAATNNTHDSALWYCIEPVDPTKPPPAPEIYIERSDGKVSNPLRDTGLRELLRGHAA